MNFHLQFPIKTFDQKITYSDKIAFVGSCFSENIGNLFIEKKFNVLINPHGIQYNPWSISNSLNVCMQNKLLNENELFYANECFNSWEHHSKFSNSNKTDCLNKINQEISKANQFLLNADWLIITLGSSFIYELIDEKRIVSNCHKIPAKKFNKRLLEIKETYKMLNDCIENLTTINKKLKIIFTVSPVRYIRDGLVENNLSKSRLIEVIHALLEKNKNCFYFPSYELIIDDLRDYRFFEKDLVHPNTQAIDYVFDKFIETTFDDETKKIVEKITEINQAKKHLPFNSGSETFKKFKEVNAQKCIELSKKYPQLNFSEELKYFC